MSAAKPSSPSSRANLTYFAKVPFFQGAVPRFISKDSLEGNVRDGAGHEIDREAVEVGRGKATAEVCS